jgi:hypothetical protein
MCYPISCRLFLLVDALDTHNQGQWDLMLDCFYKLDCADNTNQSICHIRDNSKINAEQVLIRPRENRAVTFLT